MFKVIIVFVSGMLFSTLALAEIITYTPMDDITVSPMANITVYPDPPVESPTLISPKGAIEDASGSASPTYQWNAVETASRYLLSINNGTGNTLETWYSADQIGCPTTDICSFLPQVDCPASNVCSVTPDFPVSDATTWSVLPGNNAGEGALNTLSEMSFSVTDGSIAPGDSDGNGVINVIDVIGVINIVFNGNTETIGSDCDSNGTINVIDVICLINKVFKS